jgi:hypothetical protein
MGLDGKMKAVWEGGRLAFAAVQEGREQAFGFDGT